MISLRSVSSPISLIRSINAKQSSYSNRSFVRIWTSYLSAHGVHALSPSQISPLLQRLATRHEIS